MTLKHIQGKFWELPEQTDEWQTDQCQLFQPNKMTE